MLARIANLIANTLKTSFKWLYAGACIPFDIIFGGFGSRRPAPEFKPQESVKSLAERLSPERKREIEHRRDLKDIVLGYCKSHSSDRDTYDLTGIKPDVQNILINMSDAQLAYLASAPLCAVTKFANGEDHKLLGIPVLRRDVEESSVLDGMQNSIRKLMPSGQAFDYNAYQPRKI
ncbi:MAG: hypothetical protein KUA37_08690 [Desulfomicrobium sp.]|uniref:hypothetical protein n=1 Tax=Hoeflea sp. TaxID=1940281 RepID=UPI0025BFEA84|nr:hypothetical protein [Hoeflea sp.]MBU4532024.1 hypothetical protein [Alphaproteobacteria bacterium]MBV1712064.1 hypothetical protein [Desulfomicrobium sp.]MBV1781843.1 hypothetical protein [Hoeflea sp.]